MTRTAPVHRARRVELTGADGAEILLNNDIARREALRFAKDLAQRRRLQEAAAIAEDVIDSQPDDTALLIEAHGTAAMALRARGAANMPEAIEHCRRALAIAARATMRNACSAAHCFTPGARARP